MRWPSLVSQSYLFLDGIEGQCVIKISSQRLECLGLLGLLALTKSPVALAGFRFIRGLPNTGSRSQEFSTELVACLALQSGWNMNGLSDITQFMKHTALQGYLPITRSHKRLGNRLPHRRPTAPIHFRVSGLLRTTLPERFANWRHLPHRRASRPTTGCIRWTATRLKRPLWAPSGHV
jgi:hypothetical protein